jgi:hypothetical protein
VDAASPRCEELACNCTSTLQLQKLKKKTAGNLLQTPLEWSPEPIRDCFHGMPGRVHFGSGNFQNKNRFKTGWLTPHFFEIEVFAMGTWVTPFRNSPGYHGPDLEYDTARNSWEGLSDPILGTLAALCWIRHCKEWIRPGEVLLELHVHPRPRLRLDMDPWLDASTPGCFRTRTSSRCLGICLIHALPQGWDLRKMFHICPSLA